MLAASCSQGIQSSTIIEPRSGLSLFEANEKLASEVTEGSCSNCVSEEMNTAVRRRRIEGLMLLTTMGAMFALGRFRLREVQMGVDRLA